MSQSQIEVTVSTPEPDAFPVPEDPPVKTIDDVIAEARAKHGEIFPINAPAGSGTTVFVRRVTADEWKQYQSNRDDATMGPVAGEALAKQCVVVPDALGFEKLLDDYAAYSQVVTNEVNAICGGRVVPAQPAEAAVVEALKKAWGDVRAVDVPKDSGLTIYVRRLKRLEFRAFQRDRDEQRAKADFDLCTTCVVHPGDNAITSILKRYPIYTSLLAAQILFFSGLETETAQKKG